MSLYGASFNVDQIRMINKNNITSSFNISVKLYLCFCLFIYLWVLSSPFSIVAFASADPASQHSVKAAFVLNFIKFVEFDNSQVGASSNSYKMCAVGESSFSSFLDKLDEQKIRDKTINLTTVSSANAFKSDFSECQIIFIQQSERDRFKDIITLASGKNSLIISDIPMSCQSGSHIELFVEDNRVRFKMNFEELKREKISFESRVLRLARKCGSSE